MTEGRTAPGGPTVQRMLVGTQLRRLRIDAGLSREQAGEAIRASEWKIHRLENGQVGFKDRDIVVEQELRSDLPLLQLDRDQMKQAFYNVIKNSVEAMQRHGILRIRTDLDDTHVVIRFADTGGGMSAENLSRVFEPYFTTKPSGTGLGLLIVRRIVREHGGELSIESSQGKGLTLTIRLPYIENRIRMLEEGESKPSSED